MFAVTFGTQWALGTLAIALLFGSQVVLSQTGNPIGVNLTHPQARSVETPPCIQPAPLFAAADYKGPLKKLVSPSGMVETPRLQAKQDMV
jgi:hypothetical protein